MTLTVGSLFSGIGGLDLGLERAGMTVRWQSEIDPYASRVLAKHWPDVPNLGDITQIDWEDVERVDLICGGYPCQPFSVAGKRRGTADERHLWPYFRDALRVLRPRYALLENVPGHLSLGFDRVLGDLAELGFDAEWDCVGAVDVGAPHRRKRLFIVAHANHEGLQGHGAEHGLREDCCEVEAFGRGDAAVVADSDGTAGDVTRGTGQAVSRPSSVERSRRRGCSFGDAWATEPDVGRVAHGVPAALDGGLIENAHEVCFTESRAAGLPSLGSVRIMWDNGTAPAASSRPQRCVVCGDPLPVLPHGSGSGAWKVGAREPQGEGLRHLRAQLHGIQPLTGEELLAGVPSRSWSAERAKALGSRTDRLRALGNAVVPQVAEWIGTRILEQLEAVA